MTEEEKQQSWNEFKERQEFERGMLTHNGVFTEEQAKQIQLYVELFFYKKPPIVDITKE